EPAPQAVVPPAPLTLEQQPASPPQVDFQNGRLTIIAQNSTLGDVLRAVRSETGATVEIPANATERVVGHIGPGPAREVLASLLNGSHFDYVILGSPTNPGALDRVILLPKSTGEAATNLASQPNPGNQVYAQPQQQAQNPNPVPSAQVEEEMSNEEFAADDGSDTDAQADQA